MSNPFKTKEFKQQQDAWYKQLKQEGFADIERSDKVGKASGRLKTDALKNILQSYTPEQFAVKQDYYRLAGQFLHDYKFKSEKERTIWQMHSDGVSVRDIIKALKSKGMTAYKNLVHGTIMKLTEEMKNYVRKS